MATIITVDQAVPASVAFQDKAGNAAAVDGVPAWATSDGNVASVTAAVDGLSALVVAVNVGSCQVSVTADADLGAGIRQIIGLADLQVVGGEASVVNVALGAPQPKP